MGVRLISQLYHELSNRFTFPLQEKSYQNEFAGEILSSISPFPSICLEVATEWNIPKRRVTLYWWYVKFLFKLVNTSVLFLVQALFEDKLLHKAQRGLFISKPKYGIFVTAFYKEDLPVNIFTIRDQILDAVRDVVNYALELEKAKGNG